MKNLSIDLETYSDVDIDNGVYKYSESPNFEILLFGYSVDGDEVNVVDLASGEKIPEEILKALTDNTVIKWAFNANFERVCLSVWLKKYYPKYFKGYNSNEEALKNYLDPTSWHCSKVWANTAGLSHSLKAVGETYLINQKMAEGKGLIRYFCTPCKPNKKNEGRTRNLPEHAPEKWTLFKEYNKRDVEVELAIREHLQSTPVPEEVWAQYILDQKINDTGVKIDKKFVEQALAVDKEVRLANYIELGKETGIKNPNSTQQLKGWLKTKGVITPTLDQGVIDQLLADYPDGEIAKALKLKRQLSKNSTKKYQKMLEMQCADGRVRGCFMFYGAITTGRWAGRGIQLQNLPQNHISELSKARNAVLNMDWSAMKQYFYYQKDKNSKIIHYSFPDALSQLLRTALIPEPGYKFIVSDYSQIEARVLSWLAGEQWRLDAFRANKDIYCASASQMFGVPVEKNGQNADLRVKGKIAELALGYGGGTNALVRMGALESGLKEDELSSLVEMWRSSNAKIVEFWRRCSSAAMGTIRNSSYIELDNISFWKPENVLLVKLPSGRSLSYRNPYIINDVNGYKNIIYDGADSKKVKDTKTYGAKLVENIVQAISRDILAYALQNLSNYRVVAHVHDEVIVEVPEDTPVNTIRDIMEQTPPWIEGLPLKAEGYECPYYQKQ